MPYDLAVRLRSAVALAGRYPLLAGVDLDVRTGEILALKGANGAGKTSLLRVMAGLLPLAAGEATVLGLDPTSDARALRRQVGLLGHRNGLYDDLSAEENVRFAARAARPPKRAAREALERLGIRDRLADLPAGKLSAGQRRRVALAALLARRPRLWLLDEPHAGLDAEHRELLDGLLKEVAAARGNGRPGVPREPSPARSWRTGSPRCRGAWSSTGCPRRAVPRPTWTAQPERPRRRHVAQPDVEQPSVA